MFRLFKTCSRLHTIEFHTISDRASGADVRRCHLSDLCGGGGVSGAPPGEIGPLSRRPTARLAGRLLRSGMSGTDPAVAASSSSSWNYWRYFEDY